MKILLLLLIPLLTVPAFAETQTMPTDQGVLDVKLTYDPIEPNVQTKIKIDFINPQTQRIQEHIDYKVTIKTPTDQELVLTSSCNANGYCHTSKGDVSIPTILDDVGTYKTDISVIGILFQPITEEIASFDIIVGEANAQTMDEKPDENGGCLIATATFGSELAPQVQQLRELRDNTVLQTSSGIAFMSAFNQFYYSFSPAIADLERENPVFKEAIKIALLPMLSSFSLLNAVEIDSEQEMVGYGISIILLNIGMYLGVPIFGILRLYQFRKN